MFHHEKEREEETGGKKRNELANTSKCGSERQTWQAVGRNGGSKIKPHPERERSGSMSLNPEIFVGQRRSWRCKECGRDPSNMWSGWIQPPHSHTHFHFLLETATAAITTTLFSFALKRIFCFEKESKSRTSSHALDIRQWFLLMLFLPILWKVHESAGRNNSKEGDEAPGMMFAAEAELCVWESMSEGGSKKRTHRLRQTDICSNDAEVASITSGQRLA